MKRILLAALLLLPALPAEAETLDVVASFSVLGEIVQEVAGDRAVVHTLVGPDGDAHSFEPTPNDAKTLGSADLVIVNGLGLEKWMERLIEASGYKGIVAVASRGVHPRLMEEEGTSATDPHAWQDLANGRLYVRNVADALATADPADAAYFNARAKSYDATLSALDAWVRAEIAQVPAAKRRVITTHDAFGYFGAAYGVTFLAPEGISTDAEPTAGGLAKLIDQVRREKIKALFLENITSPQLMQTIAQETGVPLGGSLFSDALSPPDGPAPTYVDMFKNNLPKLVDGMEKN
ncbi:MAG TPA: metal ABC transporter substrate-binding protein [Dongiaceae bacterium]|jgi:zinc/manganese transport system substrate-binding protein|nr:metal ABC transporter substrate-binding protein [Dongiaceae bacterium]